MSSARSLARCFDSTYEGLKLRPHAHTTSDTWRFDSTYEGLKQGAGSLPSRAARGFDSTYEGLKLGFSTPREMIESGFRQYL